MIGRASGGCVVLREGNTVGLSWYQRTLPKRILLTKVRWACKLMYWFLIVYLRYNSVDIMENTAVL